MFVKNKKGTGTRACPCGSWLKHWERGAKSDVVYCGTKICMKRTELGGHVVKSDGTDTGVYIVPLCPDCSRREDVFEVGVMLVPAGEQAFCGVSASVHREGGEIREENLRFTRP